MLISEYVELCDWVIIKESLGNPTTYKTVFFSIGKIFFSLYFRF